MNAHQQREALRIHESRFGQQGALFLAPARVNLIGEHTDYTGGFVLPMAISFHTAAVISPHPEGEAAIYSSSFDEEVSFDIASQPAPQGHWSDYPLGVLWSLRQQGISAESFRMSLAGDVPLGAGLSSSASVSVATAMALLSQTSQTLPLETLAAVCRRAENDYVGAKSGIMDQFIVAGGVTRHAMLLDCRSLHYEMLLLPEDVRIVVCNSMVKHAVATGEYGTRRDEVEAGQAILQQHRPGITLLRDAMLADLEACREQMSPRSYARCRHILTENQRVMQAKEALLAGDMSRLGRLLIEAHASMRDDFEASCAEVDALVEIAVRQPGCYGARITGGGFGGCTVNLVHKEQAESFVKQVREDYERQTGIAADCFLCEAADGAIAMRDSAQ
ncbi:MAG TPA: galactokinase [Granulicella sp.]